MKKLYWVNILLLSLVSCVSSPKSLDLSAEYYNLGNAYLKLGDIQKAKDYYLKVLELDYTNNSARFNLVEISVKLTDFVSAREHLDYLINIDKDNIKVKKMFAYVYYVEGNLQESLACYLDVYVMGDVSYDVRLNIVKLYYQLELYSEAALYIDDLLFEDENLDTYFLAGVVFHESVDLNNAVLYYEKCIDLGSTDADLLNRLTIIYENLSDIYNLKRVLNISIDNDISDDRNLNLFKLAKILLVGENNFSEGYSVLEDALMQGFNDEDRALGLLEEPNLMEVDKIRQLFIENEVLER